ncbi:24902_t:CDS:2 [Gigaspora margarita]|uniref:24902_t:CDS:1 n=1 Tax=Gigaspora margarita TaxID=4874 RepID=A0ABN7VSD4_GIGMA|nr:24902_t:CDS:2 [Gigaspora margarita]
MDRRLQFTKFLQKNDQEGIKSNNTGLVIPVLSDPPKFQDPIHNLKLYFQNALKTILSDHGESITNEEISALISNESNNTTLADCFVYLIKLAIAINNLSDMNNFKISAICIFNRRYKEFLHPLYILAYYIHLEYKEKYLNDNRFHMAALTAIELWQNLGHTQTEGEELVAQLRYFKAQWPLFNLPYVTDAYNIALVANIMDYKEESQIRFDVPNSLDDITSDNSTTLLIEDIVDLMAKNNSRPVEVTQVTSADLDYDP